MLRARAHVDFRMRCWHMSEAMPHLCAMRINRGRRNLIGLVLIALAVPTAYTTSDPERASAAGQQISYGPNGTINAILADGVGGAYVGGAFTGWGYQTGGLASISASTAAPDLAFPDVDGTVLAIEPDGNGGFFLGGNFDEVGGEGRANLAHIDASGNVTDWAPETDDSVFALELHDGLLFAGGRFFEVWDEATEVFLPQPLAAAFDSDTAALSSWNPGFSLSAPGGWFNLVNEAVWDFHIVGTDLYVAGAFNALTWDSPAVERSAIAAFDLASLTDGSNGLNAFAPDPDGPVLAMATSPGGELIIGGIFENVGATAAPRMSVAEINVVTAEETAFNVPVIFDDGTVSPGQVQAITVTGTDILIGGWFDKVGGQSRPNLALVSSVGLVNAWAPAPDAAVNALAVSGDSYYVGGSFSHINGQPRKGIAKFHAMVFASAWDPGVDDSVSAVSVAGEEVLIGGRFNLVDSIPALQLVRVTSAGTLDDTFIAASSMATGFYDEEVTALAMWSGELAVARTGFDDDTEDQVDSLEWLSPTTGTATTRLPFVPNGIISSLVAGSRLYAGGSFTSVDPPGASAEVRSYGFGVLSDGESLAAWAPAFAGPVEQLHIDDRFVYAVGEGPQTGAYVGGTPFAVRAAGLEDGEIDNTWSVDFDRGGTAQYGEALSITTWAGSVVIGGRLLTSTDADDRGFSLLGASPASGAITWQSNINGRSRAIALVPRASSLIIGGRGSFNTSNTDSSPFQLAILDGPTPPATRMTWQPDGPSGVNAVVISGGNVFAGGRSGLLITPAPDDDPNGGGGGGGTPASDVTDSSSGNNTQPQPVLEPNLDVRLRPGASAVFIQGRSIPVTAQAGPKNTSLIVIGGGGALTVPSPGGLGADGAPDWRPGTSTSLTATGFRPGSPVATFLLSSPTSFGLTTVGMDGIVTVPIAVPKGMALGDHTLQVVGSNAQGQSRLVAVGLRVSEIRQTAGTQVRFAMGSARLTPAARASLRRLVAQTAGEGKASVTGVTKRRPTAGQRSLAMARARAVAEFMQDQGFTGVIKIRVKVASMSQTWRDRRVEVSIDSK